MSSRYVYRGWVGEDGVQIVMGWKRKAGEGGHASRR